jgi:uncharacterized protein YhbP (UPF0306 family)
MDQQIVQFIGQQHIATVCCLDDQISPYCFNCMYVYNQDKGQLYFKSSFSAHHSGLLVKHPIVSGTILPDKLDLKVVQGIQFTGRMITTFAREAEEAAKIYHKILPQGLARSGEIFILELTHIKMTDNSQDTFKKICWNRSVVNV